MLHHLRVGQQLSGNPCQFEVSSFDVACIKVNTPIHKSRFHCLGLHIQCGWAHSQNQNHPNHNFGQMGDTDEHQMADLGTCWEVNDQGFYLLTN